MDARRMAGIAAGGVLGATVRWAVVSIVTTDGSAPWPVLGLNVVGSLVLGVLLAEEWTHPRARRWLRDFGGIGFCGGMTTFSTFSVEIVELVRDERLVVAGVYGTLSVVLSAAAVVAGATALRRVRAGTLAIEGQP